MTNFPNLISVPDVVVRCARFVEEHGITDGIYRVSGIASNIKRLRSRFIEDDSKGSKSLYDEPWIVQVDIGGRMGGIHFSCLLECLTHV